MDEVPTKQLPLVTHWTIALAGDGHDPVHAEGVLMNSSTKTLTTQNPGLLLAHGE
jgi:hypothetical protein